MQNKTEAVETTVKHVEALSYANLTPKSVKLPDFNKEVLEPLKVAQEAAKPKPQPIVQAPQPVQISYSSPNADKLFIYTKESGNNPGAVNKRSGACGIGQALPCSKLPCSATDYACQDDWFTNKYMIPRYGTWANAKAFWLAHRWW